MGLIYKLSSLLTTILWKSYLVEALCSLAWRRIHGVSQSILQRERDQTDYLRFIR